MADTLPPLHLKIRARLTEDMSRDEAEKLLRGFVRSGIPDDRLDVAWLDWKKGEGGRAREGTYFEGDAEAAMESFLSAFEAIKDEEIRIEVAEAAPPRTVSREVARIPDRPAAAWGIENYNTFLREAKRRHGLSHSEAQELYRQVKEATGQKRLVGADVRRLPGVIEYESKRVRLRSLLGRDTELELTATTTGETPRRKGRRAEENE